MIEGIIVGNPRELRGIEVSLYQQIGEFDVTRKNNPLLMLTSPEYFSPKDKVYRAIERKGKKLGANIGLVVSTGESCTSYNARGVFYKI